MHNIRGGPRLQVQLLKLKRVEFWTRSDPRYKGFLAGALCCRSQNLERLIQAAGVRHVVRLGRDLTQLVWQAKEARSCQPSPSQPPYGPRLSFALLKIPFLHLVQRSNRLDGSFT